MAAERWRVFLDTHVLIAGLVSRTGASSAILDLGEAEEILVVLSRQVLIEADRVFLSKFPHLIDRYRKFIKNLAPLLEEDPKLTAVKEASRIIDAGDAAVLAAAKKAQVDYLVTLDIRHFHTAKVRDFFPAPIVSPSEFLTHFRRYWASPY